MEDSIGEANLTILILLLLALSRACAERSRSVEWAAVLFSTQN